MNESSARRSLCAVACAAALSGAAVSVSAQQPNTGPVVRTADPMQIQPTGPAPVWAPSIDPQMLAIIEQLAASEAPPLSELSPFQARNVTSPADAAVQLLHKTGMPPMPPRVDVAHRVLPVGPPDGVLVRTYTPLQGPRPFPVIVYYHGGGWVIANLNTYEAGAKALAEQVGAIVVSVAYRQAPEQRFPHAHDDAFAAYRWVVENARQLGGDPARVATAGESAGGNLAVAVAMMARDRSLRMPVHVLSVYPIADGDVESPSYREYANAKPLSAPLMAWFFDHYKPDWRTAEDPLVSLVSADLSRLPATTIINAEIDPLASDGEELAQRLRSAGVDVQQRTWAGVTHEFFGMGALLEQAVEAQGFAAARLRQAFGMQ